MSTESGSFASARTVVQLYLDNKDLGQVLYHGGDGDHFYQDNEIRDEKVGGLLEGSWELIFTQPMFIQTTLTHL